MLTIQLLLIEDSDDDALLLKNELRRGGLAAVCRRVETGEELREALAAQPWDIVISDYSLPQFGGVAALAICRELVPETPFLIVSGTIGEDTAVEVMRAGADDYLIKGRLQRLPSAIERAIREAAMRREKSRIEHELVSTYGRLQEQAITLNRIMESLEEGILLTDAGGALRYMNSAAQRMLGLETLTFIRQSPPGLECFAADGTTPLTWQEAPICRAAFGAGEPAEFFLRGKSSAEGTWLEVNARPLSVDGEESGRIVVLRDISVRKKAEQLIEEQRVSALSASKLLTLRETAGGIAHEINNPLSAVLGFAEQLQHLTDTGRLEPPTLKENTRRIVDNALRIAKIVRGLRAISRNSESDAMKEVALHSLLEDSVVLCQEKLKTRSIALRVKEPAARLRLKCREAEIGQLLLNLLNNACEAIEALPERWIEIEAREAAPWIEIAVTDSGKILSEEVRSKIFLPFFSTKKAEEGAGLGLCIAKRLAEGHGGALTFDTASAHTRFVIRLPMARGAGTV